MRVVSPRELGPLFSVVVWLTVVPEETSGASGLDWWSVDSRRGMAAADANKEEYHMVPCGWSAADL